MKKPGFLCWHGQTQDASPTQEELEKQRLLVQWYPTSSVQWLPASVTRTGTCVHPWICALADMWPPTAHVTEQPMVIPQHHLTIRHLNMVVSHGPLISIT